MRHPVLDICNTVLEGVNKIVVVRKGVRVVELGIVSINFVTDGM